MVAVRELSCPTCRVCFSKSKVPLQAESGEVGEKNQTEFYRILKGTDRVKEKRLASQTDLDISYTLLLHFSKLQFSAKWN